jgi:hypothetical protein
VKFIATLPSGASADVDEIWKVARALHAAAQPKERPNHEPEQPKDDEPMKNWYNPATRKIERVEPFGNGDGEAPDERPPICPKA